MYVERERESGEKKGRKKKKCMEEKKISKMEKLRSRYIYWLALLPPQHIDFQSSTQGARAKQSRDTSLFARRTGVHAPHYKHAHKVIFVVVEKWSALP